MNGIVFEFNFASSMKMARARAAFPALRPGDVAMLIMLIGAEPGRRLDVADLDGVCTALSADLAYVKNLIEACEAPGFIQLDGDYLVSPYIENKVREVSERNRKNRTSPRPMTADNGREGPITGVIAGPIPLSPDKGAPPPPRADVGPIRSDLFSSSNSSSEGGAGETKNPGPPLPPPREPEEFPFRAFGLHGTDALSAIMRWSSHHRVARKREFSRQQLESLCQSYKNRAADLVRDIDWSIQNGWKTINPKSDGERPQGAANGGKPPPPAQPKPFTYEPPPPERTPEQRAAHKKLLADKFPSREMKESA